MIKAMIDNDPLSGLVGADRWMVPEMLGNEPASPKLQAELRKICEQAGLTDERIKDLLGAELGL